MLGRAASRPQGPSRTWLGATALRSMPATAVKLKWDPPGIQRIDPTSGTTCRPPGKFCLKPGKYCRVINVMNKN